MTPWYRQNGIYNMKTPKNILKTRLAEIPIPSPSMGIFKGLEPIVFDNGEQKVKSEFYIKLYGKFRNTHLAQLKGSSLSVFLCIALHSDEKGYSFPSISLISKESGYKNDAIYKALEHLVATNFIERIKRRDKRTKKLKSNLYRIFPNSWKDNEPKPG